MIKLSKPTRSIATSFSKVARQLHAHIPTHQRAYTRCTHARTHARTHAQIHTCLRKQILLSSQLLYNTQQKAYLKTEHTHDKQ